MRPSPVKAIRTKNPRHLIFRRSLSALRCLCFLGALAYGATSIWAASTLITFDDLPGTTNGLWTPNGYKNLNWVNIAYVDSVHGSGNPSGYRKGVVSADQVAFMANGTTSGATAVITNGLGFDLISGYLTAAWRDGLQLRVKGYSGTTLRYDRIYTLSTAAPTFISFNYVGVTHASFSTYGGTRNPAFGSDGYQFVMDNLTVSAASPVTPESAAAAFDQLWNTFDQQYAMFVLRPGVDWNALRDQFRPLATNSATIYDLANVFAQMLRPLEDLHVWLTVSGTYVTVFSDRRELNANPTAYSTLLGSVHNAGTRVQWAVIKEKIGFIAIHAWDDSQIPTLFQEALEQMRDTRGLIIDVRANGGGNDGLAEQVARRFEHTNFVYAFRQFRNGTNHTDLTAKMPRTLAPFGPWRYDRPVILLIGQVCASSNESFIGMMTGATNVITMGDHTRGSSANPVTKQLPFDMQVGVSSWIDYLPDGTLLDQRGFQPQIPFTPGPDSFTGTNDALLSAAMDRLRAAPLPTQPILGPVFTLPQLTFDQLPYSQMLTSNYGGLTWSNFYVFNAQIASGTMKPGMVSAPNLVYNRNANPASISASKPFDFLSAFLMASEKSNLNVQVIGYVGTNRVYDTTVTINTTKPTGVQFNYYGVTALDFIPSGGTPHYGNNRFFTMDDMAIVPHDTAPVPPLLQKFAHAGGVATFTWAARAGQLYQVQYSAELSQPNWIYLGPPLMTGNYPLTTTDPSTNQQRFYRVLALP